MSVDAIQNSCNEYGPSKIYSRDNDHDSRSFESQDGGAKTIRLRSQLSIMLRLSSEAYFNALDLDSWSLLTSFERKCLCRFDGGNFLC